MYTQCLPVAVSIHSFNFDCYAITCVHCTYTCFEQVILFRQSNLFWISVRSIIWIELSMLSERNELPLSPLR